nr:hypothetical protein CFP56_22507 [Quercus suber]
MTAAVWYRQPRIQPRLVARRSVSAGTIAEHFYAEVASNITLVSLATSAPQSTEDWSKFGREGSWIWKILSFRCQHSTSELKQYLFHERRSVLRLVAPSTLQANVLYDMTSHQTEAKRPTRFTEQMYGTIPKGEEA